MIPATSARPAPSAAILAGRCRHDGRRTLRRRSVLAAYLSRLDVEAEEPSVDALARIHRAHVERVPYETFWIHLGERWGIEPTSSMERIARTTRGGYCFQLNGALAGLLTALGYEATLHVAGVHGDAGAAAAMGNHAAVVVHSLPTEANPSGRWYVDAGLGDVLHEPLPLRAWRGSDAHASYELAPVSDGVGHWRLGARSPGGVAVVTVDARPTAIGAFRARHLFNATSGESSFARTVTAQRRHATGTDVLRGCVLTRRDGTLVSSDTLTSCATWLAALDDVFGMRLDVGRPVLDDLWARVQASHEEWLATTATAA